MPKNFDEWNIEKKNIHFSKPCAVFHEKEIWWCAMGINIGYEEDGKNRLFERPVLVIKKFNKHVAWVVPITTKPHYDIFHYQLRFSGNFLIIPQVRLTSSKRFIRFVEKISDDEMLEIFEVFKSFYTLTPISTKSDSHPF
jgi:mRNA interferase MazF